MLTRFYVYTTTLSTMQHVGGSQTLCWLINLTWQITTCYKIYRVVYISRSTFYDCRSPLQKVRSRFLPFHNGAGRFADKPIRGVGQFAPKLFAQNLTGNLELYALEMQSQFEAIVKLAFKKTHCIRKILGAFFAKRRSGRCNPKMGCWSEAEAAL